MRASTSIILLSALILAGCGGASESPGPATETAAAPASAAPPSVALPSAADAAKIIGDSAEWSDYQFTYSSWSFQLGTPIAHPTTRQLAEDLATAGWLRVTPDGMIELTAKAKSDKRFLVRSNNSLDIVPMAKKELVGVTSVDANSDGTARADVRWKWVANEVGSSFRSGFIKERYDAPQVAIATLEPAESGWKVRSVEPAK
ncbi:MAG: hypothetical protein ACYC7A_16190 [Thermoanaerobaculia bacterium]